MAAMQLPAARGVADTLFSVLPRAAELVVWDLLRVALSPILGFGGSKAEPGPDVPVMRWYQEAVLDPDSLQARAGRPVGFKGVGRNQQLNRRLLGRSLRLSSVQRGMLRARSDRPRPSSFSGRMGLAVVSMSGTDSAPRFRRSMQWARAGPPALGVFDGVFGDEGLPSRPSAFEK